ncbi:hypothetical protein [Streptosporangium sp. NPDC006930]|uniref:hypothetical protein n=1 Tax=Streptosporangium sp. NPDC006930 TaxID=3154783 RepID=UPI00342E75DA
MTGSEIRVQVSAELASITRANILGHVAGEMAAALPTIKAADIKTIIFGFREAILSKVEFVISDNVGEIVGYMAIEIDWKRFSIAVIEESSRNVFQIDPKHPVSDQVAPHLARTRSYIQQACKGLQEVKCMPVYSYRNAHGEEVEAKRKAFQKKYGLMEMNEISMKRVRSARLDLKVVAADSQLPEMTVTFKRKKTEV